MRLLSSVLLFLICGAVARGQGNPDFPQTQVQSNPNSGGDGSDFTQVRPQPSRDAGAGAQGSASGSAANARAPAGGGQVRGGQAGSRNADGSDAAGPTEGADDDGAASAPMSLDDARMNFATVVETYIAKKSSRGYWSYAEKKGGKARKSWRLKLRSIVAGSVKKKADGRFSGLAALRDARGGRPLTLEFVVDFSGTDWRVVSVKPAAAPR